MAIGLKKVVLRVDILQISLIKIKEGLEGSFMQHFGLPMWASLVIVIILDRVVVSLYKVHFQVILTEVVILGQ